MSSCARGVPSSWCAFTKLRCGGKGCRSSPFAHVRVCAKYPAACPPRPPCNLPGVAGLLLLHGSLSKRASTPAHVPSCQCGLFHHTHACCFFLSHPLPLPLALSPLTRHFAARGSCAIRSLRTTQCSNHSVLCNTFSVIVFTLKSTSSVRTSPHCATRPHSRPRPKTVSGTREKRRKGVGSLPRRDDARASTDAQSLPRLILLFFCRHCSRRLHSARARLLGERGWGGEAGVAKRSCRARFLNLEEPLVW